MTLDNGATDGESNSHAVILGGVKRFEKSVGSVRGKSNSRILHRQTYTIVFVCFGSDKQFPRTIRDGAHRLRGVQNEVQDDLLKLHTIACDQGKVLGKFKPQNHPASLK